jgi:hypothetical protein
MIGLGLRPATYVKRLICGPFRRAQRAWAGKLYQLADLQKAPIAIEREINGLLLCRVTGTILPGAHGVTA